MISGKEILKLKYDGIIAYLEGYLNVLLKHNDAQNGCFTMDIVFLNKEIQRLKEAKNEGKRGE